MPLLKESHCNGNRYLTGNTRSLRVLKDKLEKVVIVNCGGALSFWNGPGVGVGGNLMDLADFSHLKVLNLGMFGTLVKMISPPRRNTTSKWRLWW